MGYEVVNDVMVFDDLVDLKDYLNEDLSRFFKLRNGKEVNFKESNFANFLHYASHDFGSDGGTEQYTEGGKKYKNIFLGIGSIWDEKEEELLKVDDVYFCITDDNGNSEIYNSVSEM